MAGGGPVNLRSQQSEEPGRAVFFERSAREEAARSVASTAGKKADRAGFTGPTNAIGQKAAARG